MANKTNSRVIDLSRPPQGLNPRELARRGYIGIRTRTGNQVDSGGSFSTTNTDSNKVQFAVVGDVHGQFSLLTRKLEEVASHVPLSFVLQVGDIECHRDESDLESMASPASKRSLGDFATSVYNPSRQQQQQQETAEDLGFGIPMYFIGGNHECYGWLDSEEHFVEAAINDDNDEQQPEQAQAFLEVAPNMFYLGRAGYLPLRFYDNTLDMDIKGVFNLAFLSGIHRPAEYWHRRPAMTRENLGTQSNRRWIGFNIYDTQQLMEGEVDDGVDHSSSALVDSSLSDTICIEDLSPRQQLKVLLAKLLGVSLNTQPLFDDKDALGGDILLSKADIQFLTRFLVPSATTNQKETALKRENAAATLPHSLNGIVDFLVVGHSEAAIKTLQKRLRGKRAVDMLMTHDWPAGVASPEELYPSGSAERSRPLGNAVCREVLDSLKPQVHCCGHMHQGYRRQIKHQTPSGKPSEKTTDLCCLGKLGYSGPAAIALFELDLQTGVILEVRRDSAT